MARLRVGVVCDYPEEAWTSMDLVAEMVLGHLARDHADVIEAHRVGPPFRHRLGRLPGLGRRAFGFNADRLLNRHLDYPRALARMAQLDPFDIYHLVDHSYAQLVPALPPGRTIITCHDLDAFRCLLAPQDEPRPAWFRVLARRVLKGFQSAAAVVCVSATTAAAVKAHRLVPDERLHVVPNGVADDFTPGPCPAADHEATRRLGGPPGPCDLLHVGSTIPRKRIDVLLRVCAGLRAIVPDARLLRVGPPLTSDQDELARDLGITDAILPLGLVERPLLAACYRRAAVVLQTSDAEGFGLPVAEALACGAVVLASDIDVLREVGEPAASFAPVGDVAAWAKALNALLAERSDRPDAWQARRAAGVLHARRYRWATHVGRLVDLYHAVRRNQSAPGPSQGRQCQLPQ